MKPVSAYYGSPTYKCDEKRALWFKRTTSGKTILPFQKYVTVRTFYDIIWWDKIYTPNEFLVYQIRQATKQNGGETTKFSRNILKKMSIQE